MGRKTILIFDNNKQKTLEKILNEKYNIICTDSKKHMLNVLSQTEKSISVIILNCEMKNINWHEFLRTMQINKNFPKIPKLIILEKNDKNISAALSLGIYDLIVKPYTPELIKNRIEKIMLLLDTSAKLRHTEILAGTDALTGLYNRYALEIWNGYDK